MLTIVHNLAFGIIDQAKNFIDFILKYLASPREFNDSPMALK
jgi:hypothetical protein